MSYCEVVVYRVLDDAATTVLVCSVPPCAVGEVRLGAPLSDADAGLLRRTSRPDAPVRAWLREPVEWSAADGRFVCAGCSLEQPAT